MRRSWFLAGVGLWLTPMTAGGQVPSDVRNGHWAGQAVQQVLQNGVMTPEADKLFHGEAKVTHTQAAIAIANLAKALEAGKWTPGKSAPVSMKIVPTLERGDWRRQKVTRYALASVLARMGDYIAKGVERGRKDLAKSEILTKP